MSFSRQNNLSRRRFLKSLAAAGAAVSLIGGGANGRAFAEDAAEVFESGSTPRRRGATAPKMLILGIDGMDPVLLQQYVSEGRMPNFQRLIEKGDFSALGTSAPPQSPVAWSNFITGMDSGGHGIYDFLHRDPKEQTTHGWTGKGIHFSMSSTERAERMLNLGAWSIPLEKGKIHQLRQGQAFWQILEENGIPTTIFKMPANFPPVPSPGRSISGMGTPDLLGEQGVYSLYVTNLTDKERRLRGGEAWQVDVQDDRVDATILGPANNFRREKSDERGGATTPPRTEIPFQVYLDPERPVVKLAVQNQEMILQEGEWSGWVRLKFKLIPGLASVNAIVRFYLQKARPEFRLYMTPLQIDPADPAMPISTPAEWSRDLARELGPFFTQGLPVDTKALSDDTIDGFEYWKMSQHVMDERRRAFHYLLDSHEEGLLFFYFNNIDQDSHMLWHYADSRHPNYDPENGPSDGIPRLYEQADEIMGHVLETIDDDTTLIVMSDHGFSPFYHGVNLNSWLVEKGYLKLRRPWEQGDPKYKLFANVDWSQTQAYALGLNGLYLNLKGREACGIVDSKRGMEELLNQLETDMLEMRSAEGEPPPITQVVQSRRDFHGPHVEDGPDIIVGYHRGYRSSWESPLGQFPRELIVPNRDAWSADHCMDSRQVPGVLLTNRRIVLKHPALCDLTVALLEAYGIEAPAEMIGRNCIGKA